MSAGSCGHVRNVPYANILVLGSLIKLVESISNLSSAEILEQSAMFLL